MNLKRLSPSQYAFVGKQSGKTINGKFKTKSKLGLATSVTIADGIKNRLLSGKSTSFKTEEYAPSVDPTGPIETLYELASKEDRRVRASFGPTRIDGTVDTSGRLEKAEMNAGAATITVERLSSGGKR